ncbi:hypothetical protein Poli38472_006635 [Pythium oligandrum]|uniref:Kinesin motor domain-containing protein n=1 Tax=Pythium oligandrum TaxID=41045 RepID=A0A8K1FAV9_PYTOL|nr:hypothetical protein Poli38472_006635 [Pythium oligandrum]|eukprot:TMW56625.1 hypothetical protein Poli38472_006635 [Pythium oligandrum]
MSDTNVQVAVRCRPLNEREKNTGRPAIVQCRPNSNEIAVAKRRNYTFDKVYGQYSTQKDVFKSTIKPVVDEALAGYNCTVFAYGQTGTGKTHTMQGDLSPDHEDAGIIPRAVRYIFEVLQASAQEFSVKVSFLQLYNEELKDLLDPDINKKLRLMEDVKRGGIYCQNLLEVTTTTASHVFELLETGVKNRITSETLMNENSSRSHSIFTIRIHSKENNPVGGDDLLKIGQLNLVDLAGSECIGRSGARNARAREAGNINQSLLTLGRVITALVDNHPHVPYRDSKLTRLLQESLGGRAKTTIIATLSPCADSVDETMSTLEYAFRAKSIKNKPEMNQKLTKNVLLKEYGSEIEALRSALQAARAKDGIYLPPSQFNEMQERLAGQAAQITELEDELEVRSRTCKDLEEQVREQKEEMAEVKREKAIVESRLAEREAELEQTKQELSKTREELSETKRVLRAFQANEQVLLMNGSTAARLFRESENRVDQLLEKIARKQRVENANNDLASEFAEASFSQLSAFESRLVAHQQTQETLFADVDVAMKELQNTHTADMHSLTKTLEELEVAIAERKAETEAEDAKERADSKQEKQQWTEVATQRHEEMQQRLTQFVELSQQHTQRLTTQLSATKDKQLAHLGEIATNVTKSREEMRVFLNEQSEKLSDLKVTLEKSFVEQAEQLQVHKAKVVEALRDGQTQQQSQLETMKRQLTQLIEESIASHAKRVDNDVATVSAHVDTQQEQLQTTQQVMARAIDATTDEMSIAEKQQSVQFEALRQRITSVQSQVDVAHGEQTAVVAKLDEERTQWQGETSAMSQEQAEDWRSMLATREEQTADRLEQRAQSTTAFLSKHSTLRANLAGGFEAVGSGLTTQIGGVKRKLTEVASAASVVTSESSKTATQRRQNVDEYVKKRKVDHATGSTPVKVSPPFPAFEPTDVDSSAVLMDDVAETEPQYENAQPETTEKEDVEQATMEKEDPAASPDEPEASPIEKERVSHPVKSTAALAGRKRPFSAPRDKNASSLAAPKRYRFKKPGLSEATNKL